MEIPELKIKHSQGCVLKVGSFRIQKTASLPKKADAQRAAVAHGHEHKFFVVAQLRRGETQGAAAGFDRRQHHFAIAT